MKSGNSSSNEGKAIAQALSDLAVKSNRTKIDRLRAVFDDVVSAKESGASNESIVLKLKQNGLEFNVNNFKNACSRILSERKQAALTEALNNADSISTTTIKGELRKLWPAIHQKLSDGGWSARDMVNWLNEKDLPISVELFRVYLNDLDREHGYNRSKNEFVSTEQATKLDKPAIDIGSWLFHGARILVTKPIITNGDVTFEVGEILRLDRMMPYGKDTTLAGMYFVSVEDPSKSLYQTGSELANADSAFTFLSN